MKDFLFSTRSSGKANQANGIVVENRIPSEDDVWKAVIRREEQLMQKCKHADTHRVTLHIQWASRILGINLEQGWCFLILFGFGYHGRLSFKVVLSCRVNVDGIMVAHQRWNIVVDYGVIRIWQNDFSKPLASEINVSASFLLDFC